MNYYLVNLSIADLMITAWCPIHSLVKELSENNQYLLPAIFCKIGVFYTGLLFEIQLRTFAPDLLFSAVHGVKCPHFISNFL